MMTGGRRQAQTLGERHVGELKLPVVWVGRILHAYIRI